MCHQTVGLVGGELERRGVVTVAVSLLPEITAKVRPPRALEVPYALGYPFGRPDDPPLQRRILRSLLRLASRDDVPLIEELETGNASPEPG